jgi:hypothetical protein
MKNIIRITLLFVLAYLPMQASAQGYIKLNAPLALVGIVNAQAEFVVSPHSSVAVDFTYSPWKSINGKHSNFGMFIGEYRYYFKQSTHGWYLSANAGMMGFDIHRPQLFTGGKIFSRQNEYGKGFSIMTGIGAGWEHHLGERWIMDIFLCIDRTWSWYNRYHNDGTIEMHPQGHEHYKHPDPFNGSTEFMPVKAGVSFGYRIFKPKTR